MWEKHIVSLDVDLKTKNKIPENIDQPSNDNELGCASAIDYPAFGRTERRLVLTLVFVIGKKSKLKEQGTVTTCPRAT